MYDRSAGSSFNGRSVGSIVYVYEDNVYESSVDNSV